MKLQTAEEARAIATTEAGRIFRQAEQKVEGHREKVGRKRTDDDAAPASRRFRRAAG